MATEPKVALHKCRSYEQCRDVLSRVLEESGGRALFEGRRVLLKVNLMHGRDPAKAVNTHPLFVAAMASLVKEAGGSAVVGDSTGVPGFTRECLAKSGIASAAAGVGAEIVNFDAGPIVEVPVSGKVLNSIYVPQPVLDAEVRVSLPKLKTHPLLAFTGALKNQMGLIPGSGKARIHHAVGGGLAELAEALIDINVAVPFHLAVMDGILGLEAGGTSSGRPAQSAVVAASTDLVALDTICSMLIGLQPREVLTNVRAAERGLGTCDPAEIEVVGETVESCQTTFEQPGFEVKTIPLVARIAYGLRANAIRPEPVSDRCQQCESCVKVCPTGAITFQAGPRIDHSRCIKCYCCYENCEARAIKLRCKWYLRSSFRKKAAGLDLSDLI